ncbi:autotransporter outer membrane beta-barrel domain-containing protein, partial [Rickettsia felis]|nr:autotransporter outer membrane beta-barrel domain-containing protein [Rickettsia felis]
MLTLIIEEGAKIIGSVTSTGGVAGTLVFIGDGEVTGDIGTDDENKPDIIEISGDNTKQVTLRGNVLVNDLVFVQGVDSSGKANIENGLVARRVVFNNENADGGTLVINAPSAVNAIVNPNNGMIVLNADFTISDPSAGDIREIKIADNIKYTIDAKSGNVDLLNNGAKIIFEGAGSELNLINTGNTDKQFTLYSNLNPSDAEDEYGIVRVEATTNNLTIANNGGPYTIGQDNTHRLKEFEVKGAGNIVIDNTIFTKQFNMNNTGQVTLNQVLDLGVGGGVLFAADGKLTANNGISGSVTTATNDTGTLTIGTGNVTGAIGTNGGSKLKEVNFNGVSNVTSIDATIVKISNAAANVTAAGQISGAVSYTADGKLTANNGISGSVTTATNDTGTLTIGAGNVTGAIGTSGDNKLKEVNF